MRIHHPPAASIAGASPPPARLFRSPSLRTRPRDSDRGSPSNTPAGRALWFGQERVGQPLVRSPHERRTARERAPGPRRAAGDGSPPPPPPLPLGLGSG